MSAPSTLNIRAGLSRHLRVEDLLLAGWLVLEPLVFPLAPSEGLFASGADPVGGLLGLVALAGLAICIGARSRPDVVSGITTRGDVTWTIGPLTGAFAFALDDTATRLGPLASIMPLVIVVLVAAAVVARLRLPPLAAEPRRALVTPFVLVTSRYFGGFLGGMGAIFDVRAVFGSGQDIRYALLVFGFATAGVLIFYLMLVFAPRQVAEKEGSGLTWAVRFLLFLTGLTISQTLRAAAG